MLNSLKALKGTLLEATDGEIGRCKDFLFDDCRWDLRYMVADTGTWISDRKVVISPHFLADVDSSASRVAVRLTRAQIEASPPLSAHEPVSAQREADVAEYYGSMATWPASIALAWSGMTMSLPVRLDDPAPLEGDPRLRSLDEVLGYDIHATDGEVGHIRDLMVDDDDWSIRYLVVDTRKWMPGKTVLVSPEWVESFHWADRVARLDLSKSLLEASPEYPPVKTESTPDRSSMNNQTTMEHVNRKEWIEGAKTVLDRWEATLDNLESEVDQASERVQSDVRDRLEHARRSAREARARWEKVKENAGEVWDVPEDGVEEAWVTGERAFAQSLTDLRSVLDSRRPAEAGDVVHVRFVGRLNDGTIFDSSTRLGPLEFTLGQGEVIPGMDDAVQGLAVGETLTASIPPDQGFGARRDDLMVTVPTNRYPGDESPTPGDHFELQGAAKRPVRVQVVKVLPDSLKVDANHPLAGHTLTFELELLKIA